MRAWIRRRPGRFCALLIVVGVLTLLIAGCGEVVTNDDFRSDCEKHGGTYTDVDNDSPMCTYPNSRNNDN